MSLYFNLLFREIVALGLDHTTAVDRSGFKSKFLWDTDDWIVFDDHNLAVDGLDAVVEAQSELVAPDEVCLALLCDDGLAPETLRRREVKLGHFVVFA